MTPPFNSSDRAVTNLMVMISKDKPVIPMITMDATKRLAKALL